MLCYQLDIKKKNELWSLIGPHPVRFSLIEFEHLTGLNCKYIENLDNPALEVTDELARFWELMGVDIDAGPNTLQIIAACKRCQEWSRVDRMRLGYLAIYLGYIEEKKNSSATRANPVRLVMDLEEFETYPWGRLAFKWLIDSLKRKNFTKTYTIDGFVQVLQVWVYFALPDFTAAFGKPIRNKPSPPLLAYKGHKGRKFVKEGITTQTRVVNYVAKEIGEMFLQWDNDVGDVAVENLLMFMFSAKANWNWTQECWPVKGIKTWTNLVYMKQEPPQFPVNEERRARKKAHTEAYTEFLPSEDHIEPPLESFVARNKLTGGEIEQMFKEMTKVMTVGFSECVKEMKLIWDRMESVEKKVGMNQKGTDSNELQLTLSDPNTTAREPGVSTKPSSKIRVLRNTRQNTKIP
ncbi:uncharacterized protein LOC130511192 [Raphanus sativus]|uniref:Uncharacterized protein LOC130511192 n=1 Tax=Raphanus sativus TaxID=3726 RepID=A0A9W3DJI6_RAPSA|nr:uncharacterized protein LOC130511192 [Raphanus sativus]